MVTITITTINNQIKQFVAKGHADSKKKNEKYDLICGVISAVITGAFSNIEQDKDYEFVLQDGFASLIALKQISYHDEIVIETMIKQLEIIAKSNKKYVKIIKD